MSNCSVQVTALWTYQKVMENRRMESPCHFSSIADKLFTSTGIKESNVGLNVWVFGNSFHRWSQTTMDVVVWRCKKWPTENIGSEVLWGPELLQLRSSTSAWHRIGPILSLSRITHKNVTLLLLNYLQMKHLKFRVLQSSVLYLPNACYIFHSTPLYKSTQHQNVPYALPSIFLVNGSPN